MVAKGREERKGVITKKRSSPQRSFSSFWIGILFETCARGGWVAESGLLNLQFYARSKQSVATLLIEQAAIMGAAASQGHDSIVSEGHGHLMADERLLLAQYNACAGANCRAVPPLPPYHGAQSSKSKDCYSCPPSAPMQACCVGCSCFECESGSESSSDSGDSLEHSSDSNFANSDSNFANSGSNSASDDDSMDDSLANGGDCFTGI